MRHFCLRNSPQISAPFWVKDSLPTSLFFCERAHVRRVLQGSACRSWLGLKTENSAMTSTCETELKVRVLFASCPLVEARCSFQSYAGITFLCESYLFADNTLARNLHFAYRRFRRQIRREVEREGARKEEDGERTDEEGTDGGIGESCWMSQDFELDFDSKRFVAGLEVSRGFWSSTGLSVVLMKRKLEF